MSIISDALEAEVAAIRAISAKAAGRHLAPCEMARIDWRIARIMRLIAPRIRRLVRAYGLGGLAGDAARACAEGLRRAIDAHDPRKARFTIFLDSLLHSELQDLRLRSGAVWPGVRGTLGEVHALDDGEAVAHAEAVAARTMARRACGRLFDHRLERIGLPERERFPHGGATTKPGTIDPRELARVEAGFAGEAPGLFRRWGAGKPRFSPETVVLLRPSLSRH